MTGSLFTSPRRPTPTWPTSTRICLPGPTYSQIYFLAHRLRAHRQLFSHPTSAVLDRSVYEDAEVFAHNLYLQGHINPRDYETYRELYHVLTELLPPPDLIIYLRASVPTLVKVTAQRNREYERTISAGYLAQINTLYETWISGFTPCPVLSVPADNLDYVAHPRHLDLITHKALEKMTGKEEIIFDPDEVAQAAV